MTDGKADTVGAQPVMIVDEGRIQILRSDSMQELE
jgi:hypothetical protein